MKVALLIIGSALLIASLILIPRGKCARTNTRWIVLFLLGTAAAAMSAYLDAVK